MLNDVEHLLIWSLGTCTSSLEKCLFEFFAFSLAGFPAVPLAAKDIKAVFRHSGKILCPLDVCMGVVG